MPRSSWGTLRWPLKNMRRALKGHEQNPGILVKLSDVYFRLGDMENERLYREKIYGTIGPE